MEQCIIRGFRVGLTCLFIFLMVSSMGPVFAQGAGRGGPQMDPKDREAVWSLEAKTVATELGLDAEKSEKLHAAYKVSRERLQKAVEAIPTGESNDFRARYESRRKARLAENDTFAKDLAAFLDEAQAKKAVEQLTVFFGRGDMTVKSLSDIVTNPETLLKAMKVLNAHLIKLDKEIAGSMVEGVGVAEERRDQRSKMVEELNTEMAKILSEEEMTKWKESTADRRPGRNR